MRQTPTPDDVLAAVASRLRSDPGYATVVLGGAWLGRRPARKTFPYLVLTVEEREPESWGSDGSYEQSFFVDLTAWCASTDNAPVQPRPIRTWLDGLFGWVADDPANGVSVPHAVATLSVRPAGGSLKLAPDLRNTQDVLAASKRVEIRIQGQC